MLSLPHPRRIQKRSFLVLEVLLSLTLIALVLFPLLGSHAAIYKQKQKEIRRLQLSYAEKEAMCALKQWLYTSAYSWQDLGHLTQGELPVTAQVFLSKSQTIASQSCTFKLIPSHRSAQRPGCVLKATILFSFPPETRLAPHIFEVPFYVEKKP